VSTITNAERLQNFRFYPKYLSHSDSITVECTNPNESLRFISIYSELLLAEHVDWNFLRKLNIVSSKDFCLFEYEYEYEYDHVEWQVFTKHQNAASSSVRERNLERGESNWQQY
jgi:hypothetical protein